MRCTGVSQSCYCVTFIPTKYFSFSRFYEKMGPFYEIQMWLSFFLLLSISTRGSTYDKFHEKCALFLKITLFYTTQFCLLIKFPTSDMSFYKTPFLWLLDTSALRAALYEAYPPGSYRQSSSRRIMNESVRQKKCRNIYVVLRLVFLISSNWHC